MKRILSLLLLLVVSVNAWALTWSDNQFTYTQIGTTNNVKIKVKSGVTYGGTNVSVPYSVLYNSKQYFITELDEEAFYNQKTLKSFVVSSSIKKIGRFAFDGCENLESVDMTGASGLVEICPLAFRNCAKLQSLHIPASVTTIGYNFTVGCETLKTITVNSSNQYFTASENVLFNKSKSVLYRVASEKTGTYQVPSTVRSFENYAFQYSKLTKLVLNEGLEEIPNNFANGSEIKEVDFPSTIKRVGYASFYTNVSITDLYFASATPPTFFNDDGTIDDFLSVKSRIGNITLHVPYATMSNYQNNMVLKGASAYVPYDGAHDSWTQYTYTANGATLKYDYSKVNKYVFVAQYQNTTVANVVIPGLISINGANATVYGMRYGAFYKLSTLKSIKSSVRELGPLCFLGCTNLKSAELGQLTKIGNQAFQDSGLESFTFQRNTEVGSQAFYGCKRLHYIISYTSEPPVLTGYSFQGVDRNIKIFVSNDTKYKTAKEWSEFLGYKTMYSNLVLTDPNYFFTYYTSTGTASFNGFKSFPDDPDLSKYIPRTVSYGGVDYTVTSIASYAFAATPELTKLDCEATLSSIGERAFYNSKIKMVTLLNNPTTVPSYGTNCINPSNVPSGFCFQVLKSMLTKFQTATGWSGIKQYIKPAVVEFTYRGCNFIYDPYNASRILSAELVSCISTNQTLSFTDQTYIIPNSNNQEFAITSIADEAFMNSSLESVKLYLPNLESIGKRAFANMSKLQSIWLTNTGSVTSLPDECFLSDTQLCEIYLPKAMDLGAKCFYNCTDLRVLNWDYVKSIGSQAFDYSGLTRVKINSSIVSVASPAFCNMPNLRTLVVEGYTALSNSDFRSCPNLKDIVCLSSTAPTIRSATSKPFAGTTYNLHVRLNKKSAYSNATGWKSMNITEDGDNLQSDNMVYTLPAQRINNAASSEDAIIFSLKTGERGWVRRVEFDVELPSNLSVKMSNGSPVCTNVRNSAVTVSTSMKGDTLHCTLSYGAVANTSGHSDLEYLKVYVKGNGTSGDRTLHIRNIKLTDSNDHPMEKVADVGSLLYCYPKVWGDVNIDGKFNVADIVTLRAYFKNTPGLRISPDPSEVLPEQLYTGGSLELMQNKLLGK